MLSALTARACCYQLSLAIGSISDELRPTYSSSSNSASPHGLLTASTVLIPLVRHTSLSTAFHLRSGPQGALYRRSLRLRSASWRRTVLTVTLHRLCRHIRSCSLTDRRVVVAAVEHCEAFCRLTKFCALQVPAPNNSQSLFSDQPPSTVSYPNSTPALVFTSTYSKVDPNIVLLSN